MSEASRTTHDGIQGFRRVRAALAHSWPPVGGDYRKLIVEEGLATHIRIMGVSLPGLLRHPEYLRLDGLEIFGADVARAGLARELVLARQEQIRERMLRAQLVVDVVFNREAALADCARFGTCVREQQARFLEDAAALQVEGRAVWNLHDRPIGHIVTHLGSGVETSIVSSSAPYPEPDSLYQQLAVPAGVDRPHELFSVEPGLVATWAWRHEAVRGTA